MNNKARLVSALLIILVLVSLLLAAVGFYLFQTLQKEQARSLELQEQLADIKTKQKVAEEKLGESKKIISSMELKLQEAKTQMDKLNNDLLQEKALKEKALSQIEESKADLDKQKELRADLENKLAQAQADLTKLQKQLKYLETTKVDLEERIKELEAKSQDVELGKIVVSPEGATAPEAIAMPAVEEEQMPTPALSPEGKILVINKDYNFAVINLGSKDGIDIGAVFSVYHDNKYIGDVKVEKVHDSMSAVAFVSAEMKSSVYEGDPVVRKTR